MRTHAMALVALVLAPASTEATSAGDVELKAERKLVTGTTATEPAAATGGGATEGSIDSDGDGSAVTGASDTAAGVGVSTVDAEGSAEAGSPLAGDPPQASTRVIRTATASNVRGCTTRIVSPGGQRNAPFGRANGA